MNNTPSIGNDPNEALMILPLTAARREARYDIHTTSFVCVGYMMLGAFLFVHVLRDRRHLILTPLMFEVGVVRDMQEIATHMMHGDCTRKPCVWCLYLQK